MHRLQSSFFKPSASSFLPICQPFGYQQMKLCSIQFPFRKNQILQNNPKTTVILAILILTLLTVIPLYSPLLSYPSILLNSSSPPPSSSSLPSQDFVDNRLSFKSNKSCDIFTGEWVPNPDAPYYTNRTCWAIHEHQNCMKYGRPDTDFTKWRWKPDDCELPIFNPAQFLEILRGKSLAFVGDSVARNQIQSLICLLSKVEYPVDVSYTSDEQFKRWHYTNYNFTMAIFWSPFLVKTRPNTSTYTDLFHLYLDEVDEDWTTQIEEFNYVIISAEHWFFRAAKFYENGMLVGCQYCNDKNITELNFYYSYRKAFKTAFNAINSLENYKGITFLRTFAPSHFENGQWYDGGNCLRTRPFMSNETHLDGSDLELYRTQLEEFKFAEAEGSKKHLKFRLLDTTEAMLLRPDGHPSRYGHWPQANVTLYNDCVHWCLPGPIDTWNDFLLEMLKRERSVDDKR